MPLNFAPFSTKSRFGLEETNEEKDAVVDASCPEPVEEGEDEIVPQSELLAAQQSALTMMGIGACKQWNDDDSTYVMKDKQFKASQTRQETKETKVKGGFFTGGAGGGHKTSKTDTDAVSARNTDIQNQINRSQGNMGCEAISFATNQMLSATRKATCAISKTQLQIAQSADVSNVSNVRIGSGCIVDGDVSVTQGIESTLTLNSTVSQEAVQQTATAISDAMKEIIDKSKTVVEENKGVVSGDAGGKSFEANVSKAKEEIDEKISNIVESELSQTLKAANESGIDCGVSKDAEEAYLKSSDLYVQTKMMLANGIISSINIELSKPTANREILNDFLQSVMAMVNDPTFTLKPVAILDNVNITQDIVVKMVTQSVVKNVVKQVSDLQSVKDVMKETRDVVEQDYSREVREKLSEAIAAGADIAKASIPPPVDMNDIANVISAAGKAHSDSLAALDGGGGGSGDGPGSVGGFSGSFTKIIMFLVIILVLIGIGVGIYYYMQSKKSVPDPVEIVEDFVQEFGRRLRKFGKTARKFF